MRSIFRSPTRSRVCTEPVSRRRAKRLDPGDQLGEGVGLDQVVVAAGLQARDPVADLAQGRRNRTGVWLPSAQGLDQGTPSISASCGRRSSRRTRRRAPRPALFAIGARVQVVALLAQALSMASAASRSSSTIRIRMAISAPANPRPSRNLDRQRSRAAGAVDPTQEAGAPGLLGGVHLGRQVGGVATSRSPARTITSPRRRPFSPASEIC